MEIRISELFDLPAHSLLIHVSVMLVPIAAIAAVILVLRPELLTKWRSGFIALSTITVISVWVTVGAGEELHDALKEADPAVFVGIEAFPTHELRGRNMLPFSNWYAIAVALWLSLDYVARRRARTSRVNVGSSLSAAVATRPAPGTMSSAGPVLFFGLMVARVLVAATALWLTYYIILAGHSGAQSVWS